MTTGSFVSFGGNRTVRLFLRAIGSDEEALLEGTLDRGYKDVMVQAMEAGGDASCLRVICLEPRLMALINR